MPSRSTLTCRVCGEKMAQSKTSRPQGKAAHRECNAIQPLEPVSKGCADCSALFSGRSSRCNACRYTHAKATATKTCTDCEKPATARGLCATHYSAWHRRTNGRDGVFKPDYAVCLICDKPMHKVRAETSGPIHKACRQANPIKAGRIGRGKPTSPMRRKAEARLAKAMKGKSGGKRVFVNGSCAWCGDSFTALGGTYCSKKCKAEAYFSRRREISTFKPSPLQRLEVYERDNWTCQLCHSPVDAGLKHPHIWSATLDHIIPQAHQIVPDHSSSNLRLAHLWCNSARGDGSNMTEDQFLSRVVQLQTALAA